jgi:hypothetical protein
LNGLIAQTRTAVVRKRTRLAESIGFSIHARLFQQIAKIAEATFSLDADVMFPASSMTM